MFEFAAQWEMPINIVFLAATGAVAWHGVRARNPDGSNDYVHLLFGCIAAVFFMLVLFRDVLGVVNF
ncbi:MAG: hypothetical protein O7D27_03325 [Alphaproteobacteria bacterium]|nr:hypothetical protein [Alphaproteobacteria bacterium]MCZ6849670.1 hypothetical protein [Alphaproteobacteria bacterium]